MIDYDKYEDHGYWIKEFDSTQIQRLKENYTTFGFVIGVLLTIVVGTTVYFGLQVN